MALHTSISPTRSNLRKIKEDLTFAYEGYDLLNQKREILVLEILQHIRKIKEAEAAFNDDIAELYKQYRLCAMDMGSDMLTLKAQSERRSYFISFSYTRFMGMRFPAIKLTMKRPRITSGFWGTSESYDILKNKSLHILDTIVTYSTIYKSIFILSRELKKVQRRVNALEKIFIPDNEKASKYINDRLEEMERDELYIKKMIHQEY